MFPIRMPERITVVWRINNIKLVKITYASVVYRQIDSINSG